MTAAARDSVIWAETLRALTKAVKRKDYGQLHSQCNRVELRRSNLAIMSIFRLGLGRLYRTLKQQRAQIEKARALCAPGSVRPA